MWIGIIIGYLCYGVIMNVIAQASREAPKWSKERDRADKALEIGMWFGLIPLFIGFLYILGCIWYFFCGGFLVFEDQPFWDKVLCGLVSLIPFGFVLGLINIILRRD